MNKDHNPHVSVIVPAYNAARTLTICIDSLLSLNCKNSTLEIIIVDDASTDNTSEILKKYTPYRLVKVVRHTHNCALAAARNTGIKNASGEIIIFLDADMEVPPNFVEEHLKFYHNPQVMGVLSIIKAPVNQPRTKYQRYLYESKRGAVQYNSAAPLPFSVFLFNCTSVRKDALDKVGLFDGKITKYGGEDTEFAYRLWQKYPQGLYYAPHIKVIHHHYRPLNEVLKNVLTFGHKVVPYLVQKHPEFDKLYGYSFVCPSSTLSGLLKNIVGIVLKSKITFTILILLYHLSPYPISNRFIRLLLASALWQGIARSKNNDLVPER
ncbi:glycosyltransferase [bacterium]|nr:glycosyltransferase [bacterium]MBU1064984.1 glycosyltransferase [bacterium]